MKLRVFIIIFMMFIGMNEVSRAEVINEKKSSDVNLKKISISTSPTTLHREKLDVNRISAWFRNDGEFYSNHMTTGPGFEWPKGSGIHAIFSAGLWIGARVETTTEKQTRVATVGHFGSEYRPGKILPDGTPEDFTAPHLKVYKVQPLIETPDVNPDYLNWPVDQGAPWIDIDDDGVWNPYIDKIGIRTLRGIEYPDMVTFSVYNDADERFHVWIWGSSKPLGVEVRQTNWAYSSVLANYHFIKFQIYNKSQYLWDSVFFTLWSDPDLGNAFDDCVGVDTTRDSKGKPHNLGYCYNGDNDDESSGYGLNPPAVGFKLLQGPIIPGTLYDTAFAFGRKWSHYKNVDLSSFTFACGPGSGGCNNPNWYYPSLYEQTYNIMKGLSRLGNPWIDPHTGDTIKFLFAGDPVTGTGFIQSDWLGSTDVSFFLTTGPLTFAPGDSQEIIFTTMIGRGSNHLQSINALRSMSEFINFLYDPKNLEKIPKAEILPPNLYSPPFLVNVQIKDAIQVIATIRNIKNIVLGTSELFDDGLHGDGLAGDNIWGNYITTVTDTLGGILDIEITYTDNSTMHFKDMISGIPTIGRVRIESLTVINDNVNDNGEPNPGEKIKYKLKFRNLTLFNLKNLYFKHIQNLSPYILNIDQMYNYISYLDTQDTNAWYPDYDNLILNISDQAPPAHIAQMVFQIYQVGENLWHDTVSFEVKPYEYQPIDTLPLHVSGTSEGKFGVRLVDYTKLKDNDYKITVTKHTETDIRFNLINQTLSDTLLKLHELPDYDGFNVPSTDGFRITNKNITTSIGVKKFSYQPEQNLWFLGGLPEYQMDRAGVIAYPRSSKWENYRSGLAEDSLRRVEIRFSSSNFQKAYRYISGFALFPPIMRMIKHPEFRPFVKDSIGTGFLYQDFEKYRLGIIDSGYVVPFTVWEVDPLTGNNPRQLDVAIVERNDSLYRKVIGSYGQDSIVYLYYGNIDGRWNPSPYIGEYSRSGDEIIIIFNTTYTDTPKFIYTGGTTDYYKPHFNLLDEFQNLPAMYVIVMRKRTVSSNFQDQDLIVVTPYYPLTEKDVFVFNPLKLLNVTVDEYPKTYCLYQNFPNPFNSQTTIKFEIPTYGRVTLDIFNLLGQKVKTLIDSELDVGKYELVWDGINNNGKYASSGVYFYRLRSGDYIKVNKMMLIK